MSGTRPSTPEQPRLSGVLPVLATPFGREGSPSLADFDRITDFNLAAGADGLVFPGNASEVGSLSPVERTSLADRLWARVAGRVPIVIGLSASDHEVSLAAARQAKSLGAAAVMIAPPVVHRGNPRALMELLTSLGEVAGTPLILQNAPPPLGPGLEPGDVANLVRNLPQIAYLKEECLPAGQRISSHLANAPHHMRGVFGGAAGRFIMDELARGAIGTMPSCETPEVHIELLRAYRRGDTALARSIYNRMLPLLMFTSVFKAAGVKAVLRLRGIVESDRCRDPESGLDAMDRRELGAILEAMGISPIAQTEATDVPRAIGGGAP